MAALQQRVEPLFASEPLTGVSRRCAPLPTSQEVAPVVVAYLRQQGDRFIPRAIEALLPAEPPVPAPAPSRARETVILVAFAVLLFAAAFAVAFALLPHALE